MQRLASLALAGALLAPIFLAGCDNDRNDLFGEFVAEVTVDGVQQENPDADEDDEDGLRGEAIYTIVETERGREFVLGLFVGDLFDSEYDDYNFIRFRLSGGVPAVGAYAIEEDPERSGAMATYAKVKEFDGDEQDACVGVDAPEEDEDRGDLFCGPILNALDGVLTITRVDGYSVLGSFNFFARGVNVEAPGRIVDGFANGRFEAVYERPSLVFNRGLDLR